MNKIFELFGTPVNASGINWSYVVKEQHCPFLEKNATRSENQAQKYLLAFVLFCTEEK